MSLAVIQNPLAPPSAAEALVFFYSAPHENVVNLGVRRPTLLSDAEASPYRDYNTETHVDVVPTAGLEIAFYNGAVCLERSLSTTKKIDLTWQTYSLECLVSQKLSLMTKLIMRAIARSPLNQRLIGASLS